MSVKFCSLVRLYTPTWAIGFSYTIIFFVNLFYVNPVVLILEAIRVPCLR